ncbi:MAG: YjbQ family protein [Balneolaceae bacterium]|nr:MAG: YjbQ family protein [Balneolaceae bacterium]
MIIKGSDINIRTRGFSDICDITGQVETAVREAGISEGIVNIHIIGSTASVSTIEYEPALVQDMKDKLEQFAPHDMPTRHGDTWGDDNGFSHIRATMMGPGITVPVTNGEVLLGTWQQIIVIDHDNRPRDRRIFVQVIGA